MTDIHVCQIEIRWLPSRGKSPKETIEEAIDRLFEDMTKTGVCASADGTIRYFREQQAAK